MSYAQTRSVLASLVVASATLTTIVRAETIEVLPGESIQDAISLAEPGDVVLIEPGLYNELIDVDGLAIEIRGRAGAQFTTISGLGLDDAVVTLRGVGRDTVLRGLTITDGVGRLDSEGDRRGGGLYTDGSPTIRRCVFITNTARFGGGVYAELGNPRLIDCEIVSNFASREGGGIMVSDSDPVTIEELDDDGEVIDSETFRTSIEDCVIRNNFSRTGGGIRLLQSTADVRRCDVLDNDTQGGPGGGLAITGGVPEVTNCLFAGNFTLLTWGGGVYCRSSEPSFVNCTFTDNAASEIGSAIVSQQSFTHVDNSIVWANPGQALASVSTGGIFFSFSDVQVPVPGTGNISADPMFVDPLAGDYRLGAGSPAVDGGSDFLVIDDLEDALRFGRFQGLSVDMGAYETNSFPRTRDGEDKGDRFGDSVAGLGDVNGDMVPDYAVGSPDNTGGRGRVHVISGADGSTLWRRISPQDGELFGFAVASAGDLDSDGVNDVIVGAPRYVAVTNANETGRVYIYSGVDGAVIFTRQGPIANSRFGFSVAGGVDVNNDGTDDVIVGAPFAASNGSAEVGQVDVISGADATVLFRRRGAEAGDRLGWAVAGLGDADGAPGDDFIVSAPFSDQFQTDAGMMYAYSGGASVTLLYAVVGRAGFDNCGWSLAGGMDLDGDGLGDWVAGAPGRQGAGGTNAGRVYAFKGTNRAILWFRNGPAGSRFGSSVSDAGDQDCDGTPDVMGGGPEHDGLGGEDSGLVRYISGATGLPIGGICGPEEGTMLGASVGLLGDLNGDGRVETILGGPGGGDFGEGRIFVESAGCP